MASKFHAKLASCTLDARHSSWAGMSAFGRGQLLAGVQVSTLQKGPKPRYKTTLQFIVPMDAAFGRYMAAEWLCLSLNQAVGHSFAEIGRAMLPLSELFEAFRVQLRGARPVTRHLPVKGPGKCILGSVEVRVICQCIAQTHVALALTIKHALVCCCMQAGKKIMLRSPVGSLMGAIGTDTWADPAHQF